MTIAFLQQKRNSGEFAVTSLLDAWQLAVDHRNSLSGLLIVVPCCQCADPGYLVNPAQPLTAGRQDDPRHFKSRLHKQRRSSSSFKPEQGHLRAADIALRIALHCLVYVCIVNLMLRGTL